MSYRYNNGYGAVTCDVCNVIICVGVVATKMANENAQEDLCRTCKMRRDKERG